jgi:1-deoxy-D-xylulose-5-phosphate reductoisomerase
MVILGSTGSIGRNTLEVAERYSLSVEVLTANRSVELLNSQIAKFSPEIVVIGEKDLVSKVNHNRVYFGTEGILRAIEESKSPIVVNALVGFSGLRPTLKTLEIGKRLALANKESLVNAGAFLNSSKIEPIDSEHFALWYLLNGREVKEMTITASGGAFRDWDISKIAFAKPSDALKHPNWDMGNKITVDSATMVNKLFELLEAKWLFKPKNLSAVIEKSSIIHGIVSFVDGSTTAHISKADMKLPIAFALLKEISEEIISPVPLTEMEKVSFLPILVERYPIWEIKDELLKFPKKGVIVNTANDFYVSKFLRNEIPFGEISKGVLETFEKFHNREPSNIDEVFDIVKEIESSLK